MSSVVRLSDCIVTISDDPQKPKRLISDPQVREWRCVWTTMNQLGSYDLIMERLRNREIFTPGYHRIDGSCMAFSYTGPDIVVTLSVWPNERRFAIDCICARSPTCRGLECCAAQENVLENVEKRAVVGRRY